MKHGSIAFVDACSTEIGTAYLGGGGEDILLFSCGTNLAVLPRRSASWVNCTEVLRSKTGATLSPTAKESCGAAFWEIFVPVSFTSDAPSKYEALSANLIGAD